MTFGLPVADVDNEPAYKWGARAIFNRNQVIDLLPDRQSATGRDTHSTELKFLMEWVNRVALPRLRVLVKDLDLQGNERRRVGLVDKQDGYVIAANTNGSHGYLYIVAYPGYEEGEEFFGVEEVSP